jgi:hypothetical protein
LSINAPPLNRNDPFGHRVGLDHGARSVCRNSRTAPAALKSP